MDDFRTPEVANLGTAFAGLGSDAARRLCDQSQGYARVIGEWNTEVAQFLSHRVTRNLDAAARIMRCGNLQDALSIQTEWFGQTTDDYLKQFGKLFEANVKVVSDAVRPVQEAAVLATEQARPSPAKVAMKVPA